jgi:hypothetical protein
MARGGKDWQNFQSCFFHDGAAHFFVLLPSSPQLRDWAGK